MSAQKKGLGRGLASLIPGATMPAATPAAVGTDEEKVGKLRKVSIDKIIPNRMQPRMQMEEEGLEMLAETIRRHGIQQPIIVSEPDSEGRYEIIAGERRWRAARKAGLAEVEVIVRSADQQERLLLALMENIQRQDLNPLEAALAYRRLEEEFGLTQEEIAKQVGKSRAAVANTLRLLDLPPEVQDRIRRGEMTEGHGRAILMIGDEASRRALADRIAQEKLTVRETESIASQIANRRREIRRRGRSATPELIQLERELQHRWGTRVSVRGSPRAGRIVLYYFGLEELERLARALRSAAPADSDVPDAPAASA